jgi:hypothetical protein
LLKIDIIGFSIYIQFFQQFSRWTLTNSSMAPNNQNVPKAPKGGKDQPKSASTQPRKLIARTNATNAGHRPTEQHVQPPTVNRTNTTSNAPENADGDDSDEEPEQGQNGETVTETTGTKRKNLATNGAGKPKRRRQNGKDVAEVPQKANARNEEDAVMADTNGPAGEDEQQEPQREEERLRPENDIAEQGPTTIRHVPKPVSQAFAILYKHFVSAVEKGAQEGAEKAMKEALAKMGPMQGPRKTRTKPASKKSVKPVRAVSPALPTCEECKFPYFQPNPTNPADALFRCALQGCGKWYHAKCIPISYDQKDGFVCADADKSCSDKTTGAGQTEAEPQDVADPTATGNANEVDAEPAIEEVIEVPAKNKPKPQGSGKGKARTETSSADAQQLGQGKAANAEDERQPKRYCNKKQGGCGKLITNKNPQVNCTNEKCQNRPFCRGCKGVEADMSEKDNRHWFCCEECREDFEKQMDEELGDESSSSSDEEYDEEPEDQPKDQLQDGSGSSSSDDKSDEQPGDQPGDAAKDKPEDQPEDQLEPPKRTQCRNKKCDKYITKRNTEKFCAVAGCNGGFCNKCFELAGGRYAENGEWVCSAACLKQLNINIREEGSNEDSEEDEKGADEDEEDESEGTGHADEGNKRLRRR